MVQPLQRRCVCTMQQVGDGAWVKPDGAGYYPPQPGCAESGGQGFIALRDPGERAIIAVWFGECPQCGFQNGTYIQYEGMRPPPEEHLPPCLDGNCPVEHCEYVRVWS